ncbi:MAG: hypothetical protein Q9201_007671 [Fulgogasparrea decipioides]
MSAPPLPNNSTCNGLSPHQLFYLSFLRIYVSTHFNRNFEFHHRLTTKDCGAIYLELHDSEDDNWIRARDLNRKEPGLLKAMMESLGLARKRWDRELILPVGPVALYRPVQ